MTIRNLILIYNDKNITQYYTILLKYNPTKTSPTAMCKKNSLVKKKKKSITSNFIAHTCSAFINL